MSRTPDVVVAAVLRELLSRHGFGEAWNACDGPTKNQIREALTTVVGEVLAKAVPPASQPLTVAQRMTEGERAIFAATFAAVLIQRYHARPRFPNTEEGIAAARAWERDQGADAARNAFGAVQILRATLDTPEPHAVYTASPETLRAARDMTGR